MNHTLPILAWLGLAASIWIIRELLFGLWAWRKARRYDYILKTERTRAEFALIRNHLSRLPFEGRLDPNSATYQALYYLNTKFMRSPHRYAELSKTVHSVIFGTKWEVNDKLLKDRCHWTPEVCVLILRTADAMQHVLVDYSLVFRFYFFAVKKTWLAKRISRRVRAWLKRILEQVEKRNPDVADIRKAQDIMYHMVS